jgi:3-oxoacyl-[acyl-carrier protein] reductase
VTEAQRDEMQDVNLKSMFHLHQAVLPAMIQQGDGAIIKYLLRHLPQGHRQSCALRRRKRRRCRTHPRPRARNGHAHHVRVNCITPGAVLVEAEKAVVTDEQITAWIAQQSLPRRILPIDIARVDLFLASDLSGGMTGQTLNVDCGWIMH